MFSLSIVQFLWGSSCCSSYNFTITYSTLSSPNYFHMWIWVDVIIKHT